MNQPQVKQFVIVPPVDIRESILMRGERLTAWLQRTFPAYAFRLERRSPLDAAAFQVIPIMSAGRVGDAIVMCEAPAPGLVKSIREACESFVADMGQGLSA
ncbi:hypothetical protein [Sinorhizobium fredii]|uniref:hypothetical protein n=1 Tax=Rhizobium fredii TaxID=380 RepID=UPI0005602E2A|nr:hypothetical protein [Sinorhizobium fredii]